MNKAAAGRLGGLATFQKYGREHMQQIGRAGYRVTVSKYKKLPVNLTQWAMVKRETGEVISVF